MLCYPAGQIRPHAATGMNVTGWTETTEFIGMQSAHPCDRNPKSLSSPLVLFESERKESGHSLWRKTGMTRVAQLVFPAAGPVEGR